MKKILYPIITIAAGLAIAAVMISTRHEPAALNQERLATTVRVMTVTPAAEHLSITSQGTVQPRTQSQLIPEVSGRVVSISPALVDGGVITQGEVLLKIDDADYLTAVELSEARLQRASVEVEFAGDELSRLEKLYDQNLASQAQLDSARRASRIADANVRESQAALDQARRDLERTELLAPFDGRVRSESVDAGQFVSRGAAIATLYATDYMEVRLPIAGGQLTFLDLPLSNRGQIPAGQRPPVVIQADFGDTTFLWEGELVRTEAQVDERSRMIYGIGRVDSAPGPDTPAIPAGLFVQAEIRGRLVENVVRLPRSAIRDDSQVLVVDEANRLHFRRVSMLRLEQDEVLINDGLDAGDVVCISALQTVVEGMRVNPVTE